MLHYNNEINDQHNDWYHTPLPYQQQKSDKVLLSPPLLKSTNIAPEFLSFDGNDNSLLLPSLDDDNEINDHSDNKLLTPRLRPRICTNSVDYTEQSSSHDDISNSPMRVSSTSYSISSPYQSPTTVMNMLSLSSPPPMKKYYYNGLYFDEQDNDIDDQYDVSTTGEDNNSNMDHRMMIPSISSSSSIPNDLLLPQFPELGNNSTNENDVYHLSSSLYQPRPSRKYCLMPRTTTNNNNKPSSLYDDGFVKK